MIAVVIDYSDKVERLYEKSVPLEQVIQDYYIPFIPFINSVLWPIFALISVIFFTSRMAYNSEIISIFNAGVSYRRFLRPYLVGTLIIAGMHLYMNHVLVPNGNKRKVDFENQYLGKEAQQTKRNNIHLYVAENTKVSIRYFNTRDTSAKDFRIEYIEGGRIKEMLHAERAKYDDKKEVWRLNDYIIRKFDGDDESFYNHSSSAIDTALDLKPIDLFSFRNDEKKLSTRELQVFINRNKTRKKGNTKVFQIEANRRTSDAVTVFLLTLIGVSISSRKVRGGMGLHLAMGILIGTLFIYLSKFSLTITNAEDINPVLGIWMPNILFSFVAYFFIKNAQQ